jgi:hypothetical protein
MKNPNFWNFLKLGKDTFLPCMASERRTFRINSMILCKNFKITFAASRQRVNKNHKEIKSFWAWLPAVADVMLDVAEVGVLGEISVHLQLHVVEP